jgi:hypothetical protein
MNKTDRFNSGGSARGTEIDLPVPVWNTFIGNTRGYIKHNNSTLSLDTIKRNGFNQLKTKHERTNPLTSNHHEDHQIFPDLQYPKH